MEESKRIFKGDSLQSGERIKKLPAPPPWREFGNNRNRNERGKTFQASQKEVDLVNAALYLRRPLLITGQPGTGKTSLAYAIAHEFDLDDVLLWPITSKSTLQQGQYSYDAIGRLQEASRRQAAGGDGVRDEDHDDIGQFIRLGPVGTAIVKSRPDRPCVVLIDEIDKSDIDFPNDLLHLFEEGEFEIPEIARLAQNHHENETVMVFAHGDKDRLPVPRSGIIRCQTFPIVVLTSNGEREFPPAFLRRCVRLHLNPPTPETIAKVVMAHLGVSTGNSDVKGLIDGFLDMRDERHREIATDQLLNAVYLLNQGVNLPESSELRNAIFRALNE